MVDPLLHLGTRVLTRAEAVVRHLLGYDGGSPHFSGANRSPNDGLLDLGGAAHTFWRLQEIKVLASWTATMAEPVLDLGCGDGTFGRMAFQNASTGLDVDWAVLNGAKQRGTYGCVVAGDAAGLLPFVDASFATVISNSTLEHIPNLRMVLQEIRRVCQDGGLVLLTVPLDQYTRYLSQWVGPSGASALNERLQHVNLLSLREWELRLREAGLRLDNCTVYMPARAVLMYRILISGFVVRLPLFDRALRWLVLRTGWTWLPRTVDIAEGSCALLVARPL